MSVFSDDWRECLREQYKYVKRNSDHVTEKSLTSILHEVGFGEDELKELTVRATMRAEEMGDDFQPDLTLMRSTTDDNREFQPHPAECQCPSCVNVNLVPHDEDGQPEDISPEELAERQAAENDDPPEQLSLF